MTQCNYIINDESKPEIWLPPEGFSSGLELDKRPFGDSVYGSLAESFPSNLLIPRSDWQSWIEEQIAQERTIRHLLDKAGIGPKDQNGTNYCWIFGPTRAFEIARLRQGQEFVSLSPASAGAQIKMGANQGGWGKEGLQWISEKGLVPSALWRDTQISGWQQLRDQHSQTALDYRCTEWWELQPRNLDQLISCVLRGIPVAVGYNWWSHEVCAVGAAWIDGAIALVIMNSWGNWGDRGYSVLQGNKMYPDDAVAPRVALAA